MILIKSALWHDLQREIIKSRNRFFAIFAIVALGVGFLSGIKATSPAMKYTADKYFDDQRLMDLRLVSAVGFTKEDVAAVRNQTGVLDAVASYTLDVLVNTGNGLKTVRVHTLKGEGETGMNNPVLVQGEWPKTGGECVVDHKQAGIIGSIGSRIVVSDQNDKTTLDALRFREYTITGFVQSPEYINYANRGAISMGDGSIYCFMYIPGQDFISDYYTDILVSVQGAAKLSSYSKEYRSLIQDASLRMEEFALSREDLRHNEILADAAKELNDAKQELEDAKYEATTELADAKKEIDDAGLKLKDAQTEIENKTGELEDAKAALSKQKRTAQAKFDAAQAELDKSGAELSAKKKDYQDSKTALDQGYAKLEEMKQKIQSLLAAGEAAQAAALQAQADALESDLLAKKTLLDQTKGSLDSAEVQLNAKQKELDASKASANTQFRKAQSKINEADAALMSAREDYEDANAELAKAKADYEQASQDAQKEIKEAEDSIADGQKKLDELEKPNWVVFNRQDSLDYTSFEADTKRIDGLSAVFPVFFYLIAALVTLTTLTRMVEEQRTQIGVLRAIGYSKSAIASKYIIYATAASVLGSAVGLLVGYSVLPRVIYSTYQATYNIPELQVPFDVLFSAAASFSAVGAATFAALWACYHEVDSVPAELIRPKAPAPGRRVLLEKSKVLWSRISFLGKVTVRNLFRYKKRFFMTILGIGGCTALLLVGFGLRDSISGTVPTQYYGIHSYHLYINLISPGSGNDQSELNQNLPSLLEDSLYIMQQKAEVQGLNDTMTVYLLVPEDALKATGFIDFRSRISKQRLTFPREGKVILTERVASEMNVSEGGKVTFSMDDSAPVQMLVGGVTENYVYNYIFMAPDDYAKYFAKAPEFNMILGKIPNVQNITQAAEKELSTKLLKLDNVQTATMISSVRREFDEAMKNLDGVVVVIILCACMLAFVVLYNLTNINITERTREIATIKVLGFLNPEVSAYINRENFILTFMGSLIGLAGGFFLHQFVIETAEVDMLMYVRDINFISYIWSVVLTFLFSIIVNFAIQFRLRRIDMVESLKSVD